MEQNLGTLIVEVVASVLDNEVSTCFFIKYSIGTINDTILDLHV